jgi:uncharacterized protein
VFVLTGGGEKYYHARLMSAPAVIDVLEFARSAQQTAGDVAVVSLERLHDVLYDREGILHYEVQGGRDERMRPQLRVVVSGPLHLRCQRCLGLLDYPLHLTNTLVVTPQGSDTPDTADDPDEPDVIEENTELDVRSLIEDEVLLAVPFAPRHADGECDSAPEADHGADAEASPFAALAALKRRPNNP